MNFWDKVAGMFSGEEDVPQSIADAESLDRGR